MKLPPLEISIRVPSGRLVIDDDLRYLYPEVDDNPNCNGTEWTKLIMEAYGDAGLFHGYVGNSCPGVYKKGDMLYIGNQPSAEKNRYLYDRIPGERVAGVCTDLWWYSICDYDDYIRRGGDPNDRWIDIVKVEPGPYLLKHYWPFSDRGDSYRKGRMIYASIQRVYKLPNKWKLPEEDLERDLHLLLNDLACVYADENEGRTSFKVWGRLESGKRNTHFTVHIPAEDITNRVKVATAIRKEGARKFRERIKVNRSFESLKNKKLSNEQKELALKILRELMEGIR